MVVQNDKDFAALPEVAKLYQACKERDLTIAEREYLKGARDAWQSDKAQAVPEGFVLVEKKILLEGVNKIEQLFEDDPLLALGELLPIQQGLKAMIEAQE